MKLDYDLIRELLFITEENSDGESPLKDELYLSKLSDKSKAKLIRYHLKFLHDVDYIQCKLTVKNIYRPIDITPKGRSYLDSIRNDNVWTKVKTTFTEKVGDVPFDIIKAIATTLSWICCIDISSHISMRLGIVVNLSSFGMDESLMWTPSSTSATISFITSEKRCAGISYLRITSMISHLKLCSSSNVKYSRSMRRTSIEKKPPIWTALLARAADKRLQILGSALSRTS